MSIPSFNLFFRPVLETHRCGEKRLREVSMEIGKYFELSEEQMREPIPSRRQTRLFNRVSWAKSYLTMAGLLISTKRGSSKITDRGLEVLESRDEIDSKYLKRLARLQESKECRIEDSEDRNEASQEDEHGLTPEEDIARNIKNIDEILARQLLNRIREEDPNVLERLILKTLRAMGYGGKEGVGNITGGSGDGGVDGVIDQDPLGIDKIYFQAKRYQANVKISSGDIRDFSGALNLKGVTKGVFVTASSFTPAAFDTAEKLNQNIILIDGQNLVKLMIQYNVGCRIEKTYEVKRIDEDYFNSLS